MKLLVVESPKKVEKIQAILGEGWTVAASYGHIRDLPRRELGIADGTFGLRYELSDRGKRVVDKLRGLAAKAEKVYLATDPDREGEAISWHIKHALKLSDQQVARVTFNAIDKKTIMAGVAAPRPVDNCLVHAQEARRACDRLVGYLVSPVLWDSLGQGSSAGRVQSPAVRLVYERELEIEGFQVTRHFAAQLHFGSWIAQWDPKPHLATGQEYNLDQALAARAAACRHVRVLESSTEQVRQAPPAPFSMSTLLQAANVQLGFNSDKTAKLAQSLFEGPSGAVEGFISYHRTDAANLSAESVAELREVADALGLPVADSARKFKEKASSQQAHEAIRPTNFQIREAGATPDEKALYQLIWQRAMASQLADATYTVTTLLLESEEGGGQFRFIAKGRVLQDAGWRCLTAEDAIEDKESDGAGEGAGSGAVPSLPVGAGAIAEGGCVQQKATRAPPRYTEASLISQLEALGIGRPSTYAAIMENITSRGYIVEEKRKLKPTTLGRELVKLLLTADFAFVEYSYTRNLEEALDRIAAGGAKYVGVVGDTYRALQDDLRRIAEGGALKPRFPCPECGKSLRRMKGESGPFWSCSGYRDGCKVTMDDGDRQPVARKSFPCASCGHPMYRIKGQNGFFWGCSNRAGGCGATLPDDRGKPGARPQPSTHKCECGKALIRRTKKAKKGGYDFYGCSGYPSCDKTFAVGPNGAPQPRGHSSQ